VKPHIELRYHHIWIEWDRRSASETSTDVVLGESLRKVDSNAARKSILATCVVDYRGRFEISLPYARFNGAKQPTSSGWSRCDECGSMQRVTIFSLVRRSWNSNRLGALVAVNTGKAEVFRSSGSSYVD